MGLEICERKNSGNVDSCRYNMLKIQQQLYYSKSTCKVHTKPPAAGPVPATARSRIGTRVRGCSVAIATPADTLKAETLPRGDEPSTTGMQTVSLPSRAGTHRGNPACVATSNGMADVTFGCNNWNPGESVTDDGAGAAWEGPGEASTGPATSMGVSARPGPWTSPTGMAGPWACGAGATAAGKGNSGPAATAGRAGSGWGKGVPAVAGHGGAGSGPAGKLSSAKNARQAIS